MTNVIERSPFSELGDQQLLEQTRRLAADQRCLDVHILDHLDEIDRRGLALRRGFSSLFDYAVRELHFSDAAAQRRIQAMRLCRRHGWVRACLQSGALSMTSAGQLETTFAGAERAERQSHTGHRNVGQDRGHDQDHDSAGGTRQLGLPAAPGEADEQGERGHRSAPGFAPPAAECTADRRRGVHAAKAFSQPAECSGDVRERGHRSAPGGAPPAGECSGDMRERAHRSAPGGAPPAGECSGEVAAGNTSAAPVASRSGAQAPGTGHAGAPLPLSELNGNASPFPAPSCATVAAHGAGAGADAGSAAPSSDEDLAPQLLPPPDVPASASAPAPAPIVAPAESRHTASRAPEPLRDDPFAELSPGTVSAAPLLHPQRQRELIEQAAGMSTRQVASLLAAAAPEVLPPRDTLRVAAPDRYTLKVSIDQECEQGLRLLKDLMSHVDPRMSWGDLVARLVREAVARHDPRGGGRGQRRKGADSAGASPRRAPKETRAAGAAGGPAQRVGEASGRAPNRTGAAGAASRPAQRVDKSSGRAPNRTRAAVAPVVPARRTGGATPAPPGNTAATERQNPIGVLANAAPPSQSAPAALLDGARAGGVPSGAHAATAAPESAPVAQLDGARAGCAPSGTPATTSTPQSAHAARLDGARAGGAPSGASAATSAPQSAPAARLDGARAGGAPSGTSAATSAPQSAHAARLDGARAGCAPSGAPAATSAPESAPVAQLDGARAGCAPSGAPPPLLRRRSRRTRHGWMAPALVALHRARPPLLRRRSRRTRHGWMAPVLVALHRARPLLLRHRSRRTRHSWMAPVQVALHRACPPLLRRRSRHLACPLAADRAARQMEQRAGLRRLASLRAQVCRARRSPLRRRSRCSACPPTADRPTHQPVQRRTRPAILFTAATNPRRGAIFRRRSDATSGYATEDAAVIAIRSPGVAAPLPICCRSTTCCQSPRAVARSRPTSISCAQLITECATATDRLLRRSPRCSASCARLARHSTALADSLQVARRGYTSQRREPSVHLRYRLFRPWPVPVDALTHDVVVVSRQRLPAASGVRSLHATPATGRPE